MAAPKSQRLCHSDIGDKKKAKTDILKSYFDMTFQTETTAVCVVCFLPDKSVRLS